MFVLNIVAVSTQRKCLYPKSDCVWSLHHALEFSTGMYVRIYVCGMVIAAAEDIQSEASKYNYSTSTLVTSINCSEDVRIWARCPRTGLPGGYQPPAPR